MLQPGSLIRGKWSGERIRIERLLGAGANGEVYLVATERGLAAMKYAVNGNDIALEWGILQKLSPYASVFPKPMLVDDEAGGLGQFFYVMEWVPGEPLADALPKMDSKQFGAVLLKLLSGFEALHRLGSAFCDVKPENILVTLLPTPEVRLVDVGGVTAFGRAVRQFTPQYDRAFWGLGDRRSDEGYDMQGIVLMLVSSLVAPPSSLFSSTPEARRRWLKTHMARFPHIAYRDVFHRALFRPFPSMSAFAQSVREAEAAQVPHRPPQKAKRQRRRKRRDWTEWLMWLSLGTAATLTCAAWGVMLGWF